MSRRVEESLEEYLNAIFSQNDFSFSDSPQAALALLNRPDVDTTSIEAYIRRLSAVLENLREVE